MARVVADKYIRAIDDGLSTFAPCEASAVDERGAGLTLLSQNLQHL